jgi:hypothetical protein
MREVTHEADCGSKLSREIRSCLSEVAVGVSKLQISSAIIQDTTSAISDSTATRDKKDLLDKICSVDYLQQHRDAIVRHQDGTEIGFYKTPNIKRGSLHLVAHLFAPVLPVPEKRSWPP